MPLDRDRSGGAFGDPSQVIGKTVRPAIVANAQLTPDTFGETARARSSTSRCRPGKRAITVQVDQITGVGTVIKTGDYVDMVVLLPRRRSSPSSPRTPQDNSFTVVAGLNGTSVKLLLQGMQVLGTLLPPPTAPAAPAEGQAAAPAARHGPQRPAGDPHPRGHAQQAEVIKFAQVDRHISLILRSADDFLDPTTGEPETPPLPDETTGIILKTLVDTYGVLPPELVETVLPTPAVAGAAGTTAGTVTSATGAMDREVPRPSS